MTDLLQRWAKLEPQLCEDDGERITLVRDAGTPLARIWFGAQYHRLGIYEPLILAAVIEAIEARGWGWELTGSGCPGSARVKAHDTFGCIADEPTDPPAFPLLGAYLRALEAEAAQ